MKVSIITTCFNAENFIAKTIESVLSQDYDNYEYIIIDGGSSDSTCQIAKTYEAAFLKKGIPYYIYVEPDNGIYDGMNHGVLHASGDYINFMNADDIFFDKSVLRRVFSKSYQTSADIIYGDAAELEYGKLYFFQKNIALIKHRMPFSHQSVFAKRALLLEHPFNLCYKIAADYDFLLNCYDSGVTFEDSEVLICTVSKDGVSSTDLYHCFTETEAMLNSHGIFRYSKAVLRRKLFTLKIKQLGMDYLPDLAKKYIRKLQRKLRGQDSKVNS